MLLNTTEYTPLDSLEISMVCSCPFIDPVNTSLPCASMILNSEQFDKEMLKIRKFLNENNILFPLNINKIEIVKKELSEFILKNNMDIILILMDYSYLNFIFISEDDNNSIINGIEKLIFKKSNINLLSINY